MLGKVQKSASISELPNQQQEILNILRKEGDKRTNLDLLLLKEEMNGLDFFNKISKDIPPELLDRLYKSLTLEHYTKYQTVFNIGEFGRKFYVILTGSVFVMQPRPNPAQTEEDPTAEMDPAILREILQENLRFVAEEEHVRFRGKLEQDEALKCMRILVAIGAGKTFGEVALRERVPRTATIICKEDTYFATLNNNDYYQIVARYHEQLYVENMYFMRQMPFLSLWDSAYLNNLIANSNKISYKRGQTVFKEGDSVKSVFLVRQGDFELSQVIFIAQQDNSENAGVTEQFEALVDEDMSALRALNSRWSQQKINNCTKRQAVCILAAGENFGLQEIAQKKELRETRCVCLSAQAEVFEIELSHLKAAIYKPQQFQDIVSESQLRQEWREKLKTKQQHVNRKKPDFKIQTEIFEEAGDLKDAPESLMKPLFTVSKSNLHQKSVTLHTPYQQQLFWQKKAEQQLTPSVKQQEKKQLEQQKPKRFFKQQGNKFIRHDHELSLREFPHKEQQHQDVQATKRGHITTEVQEIAQDVQVSMTQSNLVPHTQSTQQHEISNPQKSSHLVKSHLINSQLAATKNEIPLDQKVEKMNSLRDARQAKIDDQLKLYNKTLFRRFLLRLNSRQESIVVQKRKMPVEAVSLVKDRIESEKSLKIGKRERDTLQHRFMTEGDQEIGSTGIFLQPARMFSEISQVNEEKVQVLSCFDEQYTTNNEKLRKRLDAVFISQRTQLQTILAGVKKQRSLETGKPEDDLYQDTQNSILWKRAQSLVQQTQPPVMAFMHSNSVKQNNFSATAGADFGIENYPVKKSYQNSHSYLPMEQKKSETVADSTICVTHESKTEQLNSMSMQKKQKIKNQFLRAKTAKNELNSSKRQWDFDEIFPPPNPVWDAVQKDAQKARELRAEALKISGQKYLYKSNAFQKANQLQLQLQLQNYDGRRPKFVNIGNATCKGMDLNNHQASVNSLETATSANSVNSIPAFQGAQTKPNKSSASSRVKIVYRKKNCQ